MKEEKLKRCRENLARLDWIALYRIYRAARSGRTLKILGNRTTEQLIVALLNGDFSNNSISRYSRVMKSAEKSYFDHRKKEERKYCFNFFLGGVHHRFGDFIDPDIKYLDKFDIDEFRFIKGLPPVKWKGQK